MFVCSKVTTLNYGQTVEVHGIRFWCYPAGHVLGAAMFAIEVAGSATSFPFCPFCTQALMASAMHCLNHDVALTSHHACQANHILHGRFLDGGRAALAPSPEPRAVQGGAAAGEVPHHRVHHGGRRPLGAGEGEGQGQGQG